MTACMHVYEPIIIAGSAAVEGSSMLTTGAGRRSLQYPGCGRRSMRSHYKKKSMEFPF